MTAYKQVKSEQMKTTAATGTPCILVSALTKAAPSKGCGTLMSRGGTVMQSPVVSNLNSDLGIVSQRMEHMCKQGQGGNSSTVTTDTYKTVSSTSQKGVARQPLQVTSPARSPVAKQRQVPPAATSPAALASTLQQQQQLPLATQTLRGPMDLSATATTCNQKQQLSAMDHPYFTRIKCGNSSAGGQTEEISVIPISLSGTTNTISSPVPSTSDIIPSPVAETITVKSDEDLPLLQRRISGKQPELGLDLSLDSSVQTSPVCLQPQSSVGRIQVIGDSSALVRGSVRIQNFTPEVANSLTSASGLQQQPINSLIPEPKPDYYLISAERLEELLSAANIRRNGIKIQ